MVFKSTLLNCTNPCRNWTFQRFARVASARQADVLGSNPSVCQMFNLIRCVLFSMLPWRSVGWSNFDSGLHNLIMLIRKRHPDVALVAITGSLNYTVAFYDISLILRSIAALNLKA